MATDETSRYGGGRVLTKSEETMAMRGWAGAGATEVAKMNSMAAKAPG